MQTSKSAPVPPHKVYGALVSELCLFFPLYPNLTDPTVPLTVVAITVNFWTLSIAVFTTMPSVNMNIGRSLIALYKINLSTLPTTTACKDLLPVLPSNPRIFDLIFSAEATSLQKQIDRIKSTNTYNDEAMLDSISCGKRVAWKFVCNGLQHFRPVHLRGSWSNLNHQS